MKVYCVFCWYDNIEEDIPGENTLFSIFYHEEDAKEFVEKSNLNLLQEYGDDSAPYSMQEWEMKESL